MTRAARKQRHLRADMRRKSIDIDQRKLDQARQFLGVRPETETETVDQALSLVLLRQELVAGVRRIAGSGGVDNVSAT